MKTLRFRLIGESPLLMHSPLSMRAYEGNEGLARKKIPTPEEEAEMGLYKNGGGTLYFPAVGVRNSMLGGAKGMKIGKTAAASLLSGAVLMVEEDFPVTDAEGEPMTTYTTIDMRRVVVQKNGIVRSRPRIEPPWQIPCVYWFDEDVFGDNINPVVGALERAGKIIGIGDYRVEKRGWFGRYHAEDCRLI